MRWPFYYYAKALLVTYTAAEVAARLRRYKLLHPPVNGQEDTALTALMEMRRELVDGRPSSCASGSVAEEVWLRKLKVADYVLGSKDVLHALEILDSPKLRYVLEVLLVGGIPAEVISAQVLEVYGETLSVMAIDYYAHYFWNRTRMSPDDWKTFLTRTGARGFAEDYYPNGLVMYQVLHSDYSVAMWRAGITTQFSSEAALDIMLNWAVTRFSESAIDPNTPGLAIKMHHYADIAYKAIDRKRESGDAVAAKVRDAYRVGLELRKLDRKSIADLLESQQPVDEFLAAREKNKVVQLRSVKNG